MNSLDQKMKINRLEILELVKKILKELGEDLLKNELLEVKETTRLFGAKSSLDSMGLVNLIADIEERLSDEYNIDIILANQSAMSRTHSPFRRVGSCVDYIIELIETKTNEK